MVLFGAAGCLLAGMALGLMLPVGKKKESLPKFCIDSG